MKAEDIRLLYQYNYWADQHIFSTCTRLNQVQYDSSTNFGISHGSLRATLTHLVYGEWLWRIIFQRHYDTLTEADEEAEFAEARFPTLEALEKRWQTEQQEMWTYIDTLTDEKLNGVLRYTLPGGIVRERVLWHCLLHVVNHGTQHRSEAAVLLTHYGQSPGELDFTVFLNEYFNLPS